MTVISRLVNDHGGTASASDWTVDIVDVNVSDTRFAGTESGVTVTLDAGAYSVSASGGPSGYFMSLSDDCSGAIVLGDTLTCTITNDDIALQLTVINAVVNGDGGTALARDWTMEIIGANVSGTGFPGEKSPGITITLNAGAYNVSEIGGPSGYAMAFSEGCSGIIGLGDTLTCTITNDDIVPYVPTLTVIKAVVNDDGGSAVASDWTMDIIGTNVSSTGFAGAETGVTITLDAGAYSIGESGVPGGAAVSFSADCSGVVSSGDVLTCTITDDDIAANVPTLTVTIEVVNDDGGLAVVSDWTVDIVGSNVSSAGFAGTEAGVAVTIESGLYIVVESGGPSGYARSFSADCSGAISLGDNLTCTITNDDIAPQLTVVKAVVNDGGGSAVASDWIMNIAGTKVSNSGFDGSEAGVTISLGVGIFSVSETGGPFGYVMSVSNDCSGIIYLGEELTCTVTNYDIAPQLTVIKAVVNDGGGTAVANDWIMDISGSNPSRTGFYGTENPGLTISLDPGNYSVSERAGLPGYMMTLSSGCSGVISLGDNLTCTITDDDIDPRLTVIVRVVNDNGSAAAGEWSMDITGVNVSSTGFPGATNPGVTITLDPGGYNVGESGGPSGYAMAFSAGCSGNIDLGGERTCTITNDDIAPNVPTLTVIMEVLNDDGGSALASDWNMDITGTNVSSTGFAGAEAGVTITLGIGSYSVVESGGPSDYTVTLSDGCSGPIGLGGSLVCTITADDELVVIVPVINASPTVSIASPADDSTLSTDSSIDFLGSGEDAEDDNLTAGSLVWTSSIEGKIGTGLSFTRSLVAGDHTITLTATDSQGASVSTSVALTINIPVTPPATDGGDGGSGGGALTPTPTPQPTPQASLQATPQPTVVVAPVVIIDQPTPTPAPTATANPVPTATPEPTAAPAPTETAPERATPIPAGALSLSGSDDGGLFSVGAIIGIGFGVVAVIAAFILIELRRKNRLAEATRAREVWGRYRWGDRPE